jgi:1,4-dihydroxy-2-naphthoate polyprenyltransferase
MNIVRAWILAIRPKTLPAAVAPVLLGLAVARQSTSIAQGPAIATLLGALLLQVASNLANDVFDNEKGADRSDRVGPTRVVSTGLLSASNVKLGLAGVLFLALCAGAYLSGVAGAPIVIIGVAAAISAIAYTAGPFALAYHGLGEVFVFIFFGPVAVTGTVFIQTQQVPVLAWLAGISQGALAVNILVVNNLRDRTEDERAGKRTLAVRFGERFCLIQYATLLVVAYLVPIAWWGLTRESGLILAPLFSLPLALVVFRKVCQTRGAGLNTLLARTAQIVLIFSLLFATGIVASS